MLSTLNHAILLCVGSLQLAQCIDGADIMEFGASGSPAKKIDPYVLAVSIFAFACLAVAGTAVALYLEVRACSVFREAGTACFM